MFKSSNAWVRHLRNSNWKEDPVYFFAKATCTKSLLITVLPCLQQEPYFYSVPFRASELALPRNSECLGMSTLFRGITESVPSLYRGIFWNEIPFQTLCIARIRSCAVCHELISLLYTAWHWEPEIEFMKVHFRWEFWGGSLKKLSLAGLAKLTPA